MIDILKDEPSFDDVTKEIEGKIESQEQKTPECLTSSKVSCASSAYRKYLQSYYLNNPIIDDDKLRIAPCSEFINLALVLMEEVGNSCDRFTRSTFHGGIDEVKGFKVPLEIDSIVSGSRFVLVEGPPGIGKSTLCWELCRKWDTLKSLQDFKIVLQLKLREMRVQNATSLNEIFYHRDKELCTNVVDEVFKCEGEGILLILDGFDEMPTSVVSDKNSLIMELISGKCLPRATRLVTSRPSTHSCKECFPKGYRHVEILGFTNECKVKFAKAAFKSEPDIFCHFEKFIFSNPVINSLMYIPVNCAIIVQVYKDIKRNRKLMPKTMTELYTALTLVLIRRHMIGIGRWDEDSSVPNTLKDLPEEITTHLKRVGNLAYRSLLKKNLVFTDSDITEDFQHFGLINEVKEMYVCEGARSSYSFLHLSIQEFLAAWHILCHPDLTHSAIAALFGGMCVRQHLSVFGRFLAGMIGCDKFPAPMESISKICYRLHCLYEANDTSSWKLLTLSEDCAVSLSNPLDMYVLGYALVHAPIQWHLKVSTSFSMLVSSLSHCARSDGKILGSIADLEVGIRAEECFSSSRHDDLPQAEEYFSSSKLEDLPQCLLQSIIKLCILVNTNISLSILLKGISALCNLQCLKLVFHESRRDDHLLFRTLRKGNFPELTELEFCYYVVSTETLQGLSNTIACSRTLEHVKLVCQRRVFAGNEKILTLKKKCELYRLVEAALSCPTVKSLCLWGTPANFKTLKSGVLCNIEDIDFSTSGEFDITDEQLAESLFSLADLCKVTTLKSLKIAVGFSQLSPQVCHKFVTILNKSLHCNPSIEKLHIPVPRPGYNCRYLYDSLPIKDPQPSLLERSKSLCDLSTLHNENIETSSVKYHFSCPDLLEIQSLHNLHPLLRQHLGCDSLYFDARGLFGKILFVCTDEIITYVTNCLF